MRRPSRPSVARWMKLRYDGVCAVGGEKLPAGTLAFYDPADRSVTCTTIDHARQAGLTKDVWHGAPTSGRWVQTLNDHRIGQPPPTVGGRRVEYHPYLSGVFRYLDGSDGRWLARTRHGVRAGVEHTGIRCEDAPCCGCC